MSQPSPAQVVQAVYSEAAQLMRSGKSDYQRENARMVLELLLEMNSPIKTPNFRGT
jgi:hypothetical protein